MRKKINFRVKEKGGRSSSPLRKRKKILRKRGVKCSRFLKRDAEIKERIKAANVLPALDKPAKRMNERHAALYKVVLKRDIKVLPDCKLSGLRTAGGRGHKGKQTNKRPCGGG